ncbi:MOSC domain-containing protein YiiM [Tenacibaculum adriaticum]|uniref:MOSC domain-containing protein YiiM n=1 Tax=Tenacibaculum adriaticum TaxID=413713 RepID=A0A5S5DWB7_9FLAO|nr:MOSC domain-containing protein [Tenacibaculum adriaticum]TYQ00025.1 MOSC domain-containing protein YiiM [Tenacibaculum adriaticum]
MKIISTNIGKRIEIDWKGVMITTGIFKFPVDKPVFLDVEDVKGDAICDREEHGGIDQAVYGYSLKHYDYWRKLYPDLDWQLGMFGENLTIDDLEETKIYIGDTFKVGETILEVTKPRQPCIKLGVRFNNMKIVKQFWNSTKSGVYFKVLQTGFVSANDEFKQIKKCVENPTIAEVYEAKKIKNGI